MNVGVLYPRSKAHPGITADFVNGIKTSLKINEEVQINLVLESIGLGGIEKEVYEKAEKLLLIDDVDVLVAYLDFKILSLIEPLLFTTGKLMIVVNPGANIPDNWHPKSNTIFLTLQHSFLCALTGSLAFTNQSDTALMATTFYDCGYYHSACMVKGFTDNGGTILYNYINKDGYDDSFQIDELETYFKTEGATKNLLCVFDEAPASLLYQKLNAIKISDQLRIFGSPMMFQKMALKGLNEKFNFSVDGFMPWNIDIQNEQNLLFINTYQSSFGKLPDIFALLGWETGIILSRVFYDCKEFYKKGDVIIQTLQKSKMEGPRGLLEVDSLTNFVLSPIVKYTISAGSTSTKIDYMSFPKNEWHKFIKQPANSISSGWTNTYLCY